MSHESAAVVYELVRFLKIFSPEDESAKSAIFYLGLLVLEEWDTQKRRGNKICIIDKNGMIIDELELPSSNPP